MKIKEMARAKGKTTWAINRAWATGATLVVPTERTAELIEKAATKMGKPIKVIGYHRAMGWGFGRRNKGPVIVDDLDRIIEDVIGTKVIEATITKEGDDDVERQ
jgi:hypothetical protein